MRDPATEATVWDSLLQLGSGITIFAISHQPRLMSVADHVYRVEAGEVSPAEASSAQGVAEQPASPA